MRANFPKEECSQDSPPGRSQKLRRSHLGQKIITDSIRSARQLIALLESAKACESSGDVDNFAKTVPLIEEQAASLQRKLLSAFPPSKSEMFTVFHCIHCGYEDKRDYDFCPECGGSTIVRVRKAQRDREEMPVATVASRGTQQ